MKNIHTENINTLWASLIIEELVRSGVTYFIISPGSRSAPLTVAAVRHPQAKCFVAIDERGAAYHALGYARACGVPAALICTSGTAAANYYPAVIEASEDFVPMLLLTADRPPELRDTGANQAIRQPGLYSDYCRWQFDMPCPDEKISPRMVLTTIDQFVYRSIAFPPGPVHLNCMFREPLAPALQPISADYLRDLEQWQYPEYQMTVYYTGHSTVDIDDIEFIADYIHKAKNGLIIAGRVRWYEQGAIEALTKVLKWPLFPDVLSGLRFGSKAETSIPAYDRLLYNPAFADLARADIVLHFGGLPVSKSLLQFIEKLTPEQYIHVAGNPNRIDPAHRVTIRFPYTPLEFCNALLQYFHSGKLNNRTKALTGMAHSAETLFRKHIDKRVELNEPGVARFISQHIPAEYGLFLGNSMAVRDMDMFADPSGPAVRLACNRGVSGIDGTIASATGFAAGLDAPVVLLTGDLAFLHDLNSLMLLKSLSQPLIIVLVNNHGGGIFNFLPIAQYQDVFTQYFTTPHEYSFENTAQQFELDFYKPGDMHQFAEMWQTALANHRSAIIQVDTDTQENYQFHDMLRQKIIDLTGGIHHV
ncbi:MAG TPA: 2-succinyl-5-enolpyruvyl-6-hydroxy-3-cyclohexene-1-carboxylic-acid synthase [bacterium]|nr:2-succinyl-5-enolpyruvyl-6-hydroxy-3-cyclohexene-1-carboxylic-acid synthase [bacterium]HPN44955.1 2-succinyl-5-enolpyruvyl-6-hydroxy-3-cyclohexene-1-carboxylic-acid synthase [bacterium]